MNDVTVSAKATLEQKLVALAREIAFDLKPLSQILKELSINGEQYNTIAESALFKHILSQEIANWGSALNSQERVKLKTQHMIEPVSYTHLTLPTKPMMCRSRWSPYH